MAREAKIINRIKELTGIHVEIHAARSIAKAFDKLKLPYDRTEKSNEPSFTKNFLQNHPHEVSYDQLLMLERLTKRTQLL